METNQVPTLSRENNMAYSAEISRVNPSCFLFLIDQSKSMEDPFGGGVGKKKADGLADALNRLLQNLVIKCAKGEGINDYYVVGVIGYGARTGPAFSGPLVGQHLVPISEVANSPTRVEERTKKVDDGAGGVIDQTVKFPVWLEPVHDSGTPMAEAFQLAHKILEGWITAHPESYPPIVINITDGEYNVDPTREATLLTSLASQDGNVLLFNCHISGLTSAPIVFPSSDAGLPDEWARKLFALSSPLPDNISASAQAEGYPIGPGARGFAFNADLVELIRFLDIGTRPSNLR
jgi:hypothetical protein